MGMNQGDGVQFVNEGANNGGGSGGGVINAIAALAAAGASIYSSAQQRKNTKDTIRANQSLAEYQYSKDLEMWNRANEYNSPLSQMQRFAAAGLNPNMMYSQGNAGNSASSMPHYNAPTVDYRGMPTLLNLPEMLGIYQDFAMRSAQIDSIRAQTENTDAKTVNESLRATLNELGITNYDVGLEQKRASTDSMKARTAETDFDVRMKEDLYSYNMQQKEQELRLGESDLKLKAQSLLNMREDVLTKQMARMAQRKKMSLMDVDMEKKNAEILFQNFRNDFIKMGVTTSDSPYVRMFARMLQENDFNFGEFSRAAGKGVQDGNAARHKDSTSEQSQPRTATRYMPKPRR